MINLKIYRRDVILDVTETFEETVEDTSIPLLSICHCVGVGNSFNTYYEFNHDIMMHGDCFPYIVKNEKFVWNIPIKDVTVQEFLDTHPECAEDGIYIESGIPQAGGLGFLTVTVAWNTAIFFLKMKSGDNIGASENAAAIVLAVAAEIKDTFVRKNALLTELADSVLRYNEVGLMELSEKLDLDEYHTASLLTSYGYRKKYDRLI